MALQWLTFIQYRISMAFLLAFVLLFTPLRYDHKRSLCITALCFVLTGLMDLYLTTIAQSGLAGAVVLLLEIPITQLTALWLCRYRDFRALFTGFSAAAYVLVGNFFLSLVHYLTNSDLMAISVQVIIHGLMLFYLIKKLRFNYLEAMKESKYSWGWFCLLPALIYAIIFSNATWPVDLYEVPEAAPADVLVLVLGMICYVLVFQLFTRQREEINLTRANGYLRSFAQHIQREEESTLRAAKSTAILRHDMRHRLNIIAGYLNDGQIDQAQAAISEIDSSLSQHQGTQRMCENTPVNWIVTNTAALAEEQHIAFDARLNLPETLPFDAFEFATVISNLLENAMEAAALSAPGSKDKPPFVQITIHPYKNRYMTQIINSLPPGFTWNAESPFPQTHKGEGHGLGLPSVQAFADKYNALFDLSVENGAFFARLLV